jgi:hypothetical protein
VGGWSENREKSRLTILPFGGNEVFPALLSKLLPTC